MSDSNVAVICDEKETHCAVHCVVTERKAQIASLDFSAGKKNIQNVITFS